MMHYLQGGVDTMRREELKGYCITARQKPTKNVQITVQLTREKATAKKFMP